MTTFGPPPPDPYEETKRFFSQNPLDRLTPGSPEWEAFMAYHREQARQGLIASKMGIGEPQGMRSSATMGLRPAQDPSGKLHSAQRSKERSRDEHLAMYFNKPITGTRGTAYANPLGFRSPAGGINAAAGVDFAAQANHMAALAKERQKEEKEMRKVWGAALAQVRIQEWLEDMRKRRKGDD